MPDIRIKDFTTTASAPLPPGTFVELDHATEGSRKLDLPGYVEPIAASRQPLLGIYYSDGGTSSRRISWQLPAGVNVAGSPLSECGLLLRVPAANPSYVSSYFAYSDLGTSSERANTLSLRLMQTGALRLLAYGATLSDYRQLDYVGFRAAYSGFIVRIDVTITPGTANPAIYVNGVDISSAFVLSTAGTPPDWMASPLSTAWRISGLMAQPAEFRPGTPINRVLPAADVATMVRTGALLPVDRAGGSSTAISSGQLVIGRAYRITAAGGTFTGVGAANNNVGTEFVATATNPTWSTGAVVAIGALMQSEITRTAQLLDHGPNRIRGVSSGGLRPLSDRDPVGIRGSQVSTGNILSLGSGDPLWFEAGLIERILVKPTANAVTNITVRLNTSGGAVVGTVATATLNQWTTLPFSAGAAFEVAEGDKLHLTTDGAFDWLIEWGRR